MIRSGGRDWWRGILLIALIAPAAHCAGCGGVPPGDGQDASEETSLGDVGSADETVVDADAGVDPCTAAASAHDALGCDYLVFDFPHGVVDSWGCNALLITNPGTMPAALALTYKGIQRDLSSALELVTQQGLPFSYKPAANAEIPPGATAVLFAIQGAVDPYYLPGPYQTEYCAFTPAMSGLDLSAPPGTTTTAMSLHATAPVFVTYVDAYGLDPEIVEQSVTSTTLRAIENWDLRYRDIGLYMPGRPAETWDCCGNHYPTSPQFTSVAAKTKGSLALPSIDAGIQVFPTYTNEVQSYVGDDLLIGREVKSTEAIGIWSSSAFWWLPYVDGSAAYNGNAVAHNVAPPSAWGHAYPAVPYPKRYDNADDPVIWRIIGDVEGTVLTYPGAMPPGAPTVINAGQFAVFSTSVPFAVASQDAQHPFYLDEIMPSCMAIKSCGVDFVCADLLDGGYVPDDCRGAPTIVSVQPPEEFSTHAVLLTNPNFPETWLVVVRQRQNGIFTDVSLDCAGPLSGWTDVAGSDFQYTYVALSRGNFEPQTYAGGTCSLGPHTLDSVSPFGVTVWGWGTRAAAAPPDDAGPHGGPVRAAYAFPVLGRGPHVFPQRPPTTN